MTFSRLYITPLLFAALALPVQAADCVDPAMIKTGMSVLGSYAEEKSSIACDAASSEGQKLICANDILKQMVDIDDRAWVFAHESTAEVIVKNPPQDDAWIATRDACTDEACVCDALKAHTNTSMGNLSPYIDQ